MPKSAISAASSTAMTATGSKAAPRWSSISTAGSRSCAGPRSASCTAGHRAGRRRPPPLDADRATLMRIAIVSDAWFPQVNGVVRTLDTVRGKLAATGHELLVIGPDRFRTLPCPTYPEIRLALLPARAVAALLDGFQPDAVHIATEGPLGMAARRHCLARGWRFTTSFHTKFAEYLHA